MLQALSRLRARLGDFWWYSLLIFLAARSGDLIQAFIGLWLVPHYVPQSELGAVLPLIQLATMWGLPLTILLQPLMKFLNAYATRGELGKLKRLLQVAFGASILVMVVGFLAARYVMPIFFERMRVTAGSLGILVLLCGLLNAVSPVFQNSLQALKRFNVVVIANLCISPLRLIVLLITMPIRALSGYVLGQCVGPVMMLGSSVWGLRKELGKSVKALPFWRDDGYAIIHYTIPIALNLVICTLLSTWQAILIRQRLPEVESAAYYMISRLAEIGSYVGMSLIVVVFPYAAEAEAAGQESLALLKKALLASVGAGLCFTVSFALFGKWILGLVPLWEPYRGYAFELVLLTLIMTLRLVPGIFSTYEIASNRFGFLWYLIPLTILETGFLVTLTGYGAFRGIFPDVFVDWMAALNAARLDFFLWWFFAVSALESAAVLLHLYLRRRSHSAVNRVSTAA